MDASEDAMLKEIAMLEPHLLKSPDDLSLISKLASLYTRCDKKTRALSLLETCFAVAGDKGGPVTAEEALAIGESGLTYWRHVKYSKKDKEEIRINFAPERVQILKALDELLAPVVALRSPTHGQQVAVMASYVKESLGLYQDALALLSDIISAPDHDVDLMFVIFKAAVLLSHIGSIAQSIEYIEFLVDEPPEAHGYTRVHIIALMISVYEKAGQHYEYIVDKTYEELLEAYSAELNAGKKPLSNQKKIENILAKKSLSKASEIWEMLALQAMERCDYLLASEMALVAVEKAPSKGKLQHLLAEVYMLLGEKERCIKMAELAYGLLSGNAELRNLLLLVARDKWQDKLRSIAPSKNIESEMNNRSPEARSQQRQSENSSDAAGGGGGFFNSMAKKASGVIDAVQRDGASAVLLGGLALTPEQRAREAALKEKKRKERQAKKKKKEEEERIKAEAEKKLAMLATRRKRDPKVDGAARPVKPPYNEESIKMIHAIRSGELKQRHFYDDDLRGLVIIHTHLEQARTERQTRQQRDAADASSVASSASSVSAALARKGPPTLKAVKKKKK